MKQISEMDMDRIANDSFIAVDALIGIQMCAKTGSLHPSYIKEKLDTVRSCVEFIESFEESNTNETINLAIKKKIQNAPEKAVDSFGHDTFRCPSCRKIIGRYAKFCKNCGLEIKGATS